MAVNYYFSYRNLFPRAGGVRESQIIFKGERVEVLSELFCFCFLFADFPVNLFPYVYLIARVYIPGSRELFSKN